MRRATLDTNRARQAAFQAAIVELSPTHATTCKKGACICPTAAFQAAIAAARAQVPSTYPSH